jgi:hypothetical protein
MEVNSSSRIIEKFNERLGTISLKEFKATFSTVVCELEFKYGANCTKVFAFKQLAHYVHYEALDVYQQHSSKILGVTQIPNPIYAITIATTFQDALQGAIAHHGTVPNNPNPLRTLVNFSPQQFIIVTANNPPTIDAPIFVDPMGEFFRILELEFLVKSSKKILQFATFFWQKDETFKMFYKRFFKLKEDTQNIIDLEAPIGIFVRWKVLQHSMCKFCNGFFVKFGDLYILLDVYNISKKLELAHAHYEANTMNPPSRSRP